MIREGLGVNFQKKMILVDNGIFQIEKVDRQEKNDIL